ncbi:MAG: hypothetical protein ACLVLH_01630 [Eisenbergiella massiliensis]
MELAAQQKVHQGIGKEAKIKWGIRRNAVSTSLIPSFRDSSAKKDQPVSHHGVCQGGAAKEAASPRSKEKSIRRLIPIPVRIAELVGGDIDDAAELPPGCSGFMRRTENCWLSKLPIIYPLCR